MIESGLALIIVAVVFIALERKYPMFKRKK